MPNLCIDCNESLDSPLSTQEDSIDLQRVVGISNLKAIPRLTRTHGPELERKSNHFDVLTSLTCQQGLATPLIFVDVNYL